MVGSRPKCRHRSAYNWQFQCGHSQSEESVTILWMSAWERCRPRRGYSQRQNVVLFAFNRGELMKHAFVAFTFAVLGLMTPLAMSLEPREAAAESTARAWLALVDAGSYDESWSAAAALFRQNVPKAQWQSAASNARGPLGALKSRTLQSATFKSTLPGVPDGEYVIIRFASSFENKASAIEIVTPMKDPDGKWRVSGYYIR